MERNRMYLYQILTLALSFQAISGNGILQELEKLQQYSQVLQL